jgi:hypothetical protein
MKKKNNLKIKRDRNIPFHFLISISNKKTMKKIEVIANYVLACAFACVIVLSVLICSL